MKMAPPMFDVKGIHGAAIVLSMVSALCKKLPMLQFGVALHTAIQINLQTASCRIDGKLVDYY